MTPLSEYLKQIEKALQAGDATEHTHRPALKALIESLSKGLTATNEPKHIACGAPDFIVTKGGVPLGYIECKDVGELLDKVEHGEQMARYFPLGNVMLTDYLEFRWYVLGERRLSGRLASVGAKGKLKPEKDGAEQVAQLLNAFIEAEVPTVGTPKELAERMAALAQIIRDAIRAALAGEDKSGSLHQQMEGFRKVLLHDLTVEQFADMYAQSLCYGLFAARCNHTSNERFTREHAAYELPKTNPFLRKMFSHIAGPDLDEHIVWAVDDLAELLNRADMSAILKDFGKRTRREDPVVHFYETFLAEYDPKMRESRGVYYTPEPVVSYIVRSVDHILRTDFGLPDGLADAGMVKTGGKGKGDVHKVLILDPAAGTGTFLYDVVNHIFEHQVEKGQKGAWSGYVSKHLLPRLFGFELLMAPYAVAHMKLGMALKETGYDFKAEERLRVYLTNTLDEAGKAADTLFGRWLAEEADAAGEIKKDFPVMVVLGNPPYSYESANPGEWIGKLVRDYYQVDGKPLGERNPRGLQDDYVKFIRFAQWRIEQTGYGILAFITNHGYLDNTTFRGMRQSLMQTFDDMYFLDLHGSTTKKECCPNGSTDKNVFDILPGVAIGIFVKRGPASPLGGEGRLGGRGATVHHADLWGLREEFKEVKGEKVLSGGKYFWLGHNDLKSTKWGRLKPHPPSFLFIPQSTAMKDEYEQYWCITQIMPINSVGLYSARDNFAIQDSPNDLFAILHKFVSLDPESARNLYHLGPDSRDWQVVLAQKDVGSPSIDKTKIQPVTYRPFDIRYTYFTGHSRGLICMPRQEVMRHMLGEGNIAMCFIRRSREQSVSNFFVARHLIDKTVLSSADNAYVAPLYSVFSKASLFAKGKRSEVHENRLPNIPPAFIEDVAVRLKMDFVSDGKGNLEKTFGPEDLFDYMYGVFHSPSYRSRYAEFLKGDFPRLPLTSNPKLFRALCALGEELVTLHLMEKDGPSLTAYPVEGKSMVEVVRYTEPEQGAKKGRVWINKTQYFEGVSPEVWNFQIGGYQVCQKWLKDRKGRPLSYDDIQHYQHIVSALSETLRLMAEIDNSITHHGGWPIS